MDDFKKYQAEKRRAALVTKGMKRVTYRAYKSPVSREWILSESFNGKINNRREFRTQSAAHAIKRDLEARYKGEVPTSTATTLPLPSY